VLCLFVVFGETSYEATQVARIALDPTAEQICKYHHSVLKYFTMLESEQE